MATVIRSPHTRLHLSYIIAALLAVFFLSSSNLSFAGDVPARQYTYLIDIPPVSDEHLAALADYLMVRLVFEGNYYESTDLKPTTEIERQLSHHAVYERPNVEGGIAIGFRAVRNGHVLVIKATSEEEALAPDVAALAAVAKGRVEALKGEVFKDILSRARVMSFPLSYIRTDRALGSLKAMGYNVVEMQEGKGISSSKNFSLESLSDFRLPIITSFIDSEHTFLSQTRVTGGPVALPDLGGSSFQQVTDASAQQRLMIAYDPTDMTPLRRLMRDIEDIVDVPSQQIVIEGLILEVSEDKLKELGLDMKWTQGRMTTSLIETAGLVKPFIIDYTDFVTNPEGLQLKLRALVEEGSADILSRPSILALNNHQARIRIGREVPISTTVTTAATTNLNVSYFFMGIVLNIKPRISRDEREVSMQVEAIVSSRAPVKALTADIRGVEMEVAPVIDSRVVQTFARVANNTPFIIGGLISHDVREQVTGVPLLMNLPLIGPLFRSTTHREVKNEVIVVLTPRVVPIQSERHFALMPRDSEKFDTFDRDLFRNTYRIRGDDKFDLTFVYQDPRYIELRAKATEKAAKNPRLMEYPEVASMVGGHIPGETPLMVRMLYEIVRSRGTAEEITTDRMIMLHPRSVRNEEYEDVRVKRVNAELPEEFDEQKAVIFQFDLRDEGNQTLMPPLNIFRVPAPKRSDYSDWLKSFNRMQDDGTFHSAAIVIRSERDLNRLKNCLVLKRLLEINNFTEPLRVNDFPVGMQILYPNLSDQSSERPFVVDAKVAQLFYLSDDYYVAFQKLYHAELDKIESILSKND